MRLKMQAKNVQKRLKRYILVDGFHIVLDIQNSQGVLIKEAVTGDDYLDCYGFFGSSALGHNHHKVWADKDLLEDLLYAAINKPANSDIYTVEYAEFVKKFAKIAKPDHFKHLFFVEGGAQAVENGLKTAFDWKIQKIPEIYRTREQKIIYFNRSFHGRTLGALSATASGSVKTKFYPRFNWLCVNPPILKFPVDNPEKRRIKTEDERAIKQVELFIKSNPYQIAAVIIEPIQGEGGDNHFSGRFFKALREITSENNILLVFDEVQTGFGATGRMWCYEHFGVKPDILIFGKKSHVCGIMVSDRIDEVENNVFKVSGRINSTWGGNLADMLMCKKILEIMREDKLVLNAALTGKYFLEKLEQLAFKYPRVISNCRGRGFLLAFDLPDYFGRETFGNLLWKEKLAHLKCGEKSIRFRPALIFSKNNVDQAILKIEEAIKKFNK